MTNSLSSSDHELAHNTMGHIEAKTGNMILGGIVGAILTGLSGVNVIDPMMQVGVLAFSQAFEGRGRLCRRLLCGKSGLRARRRPPISGAGWRRRIPAPIGLQGTTHPSSAKRFLAVEAATKEIAGKRARGEPLVPYMKSSRKPASKPAGPGPTQ